MIHASTLHGTPSRQAQEYLEGWQRARAELANFQRRQQEQALAARAAYQRDLLEQLLSVADNFQALSQHIPPEFGSDPWALGVTHVARQFEQALMSLGAQAFGQAGDKFSPARHEALEQIKHQNKPSGTVIEVVQRGYELRDKVIRPAKVKIAA